MDQVESPLQKSTFAPTKKVVKEILMKKWTQPPISVEGVDWVVLNPRTSPIKKLFKHKSPSKLNVGEAFVNWDSKCGTCKLNILVSC